jgi:NAD(P)-dependent dehydrogenase (short-subunit alcohol dehydrogenase family)
MIEDFAGKTAVITGGASGIGLALVRRLGQEGANVVVADVEAGALERTATELDNAGVPNLAVLTDVTDQAQITALADAAEQRFGPVHLLHNNAGVTTVGLAEEQSDAQWDWVLQVNLLAVIAGCRTFLPRMKAHGEAAHILNTASMAGMAGGPFMAPYFTTKFAVVGLSEGLWHEAQMVQSNVGISVLCPAFVRTGIARSDRNQPDTMGGWVVPESQLGSKVGEHLTAGVDAGIEPSAVADAIVAGIREDKLWILTHPESADSIRSRSDAIVSTGKPAQVRNLGN